MLVSARTATAITPPTAPVISAIAAGYEGNPYLHGGCQGIISLSLSLSSRCK
ncbi:hypothetical protein QJS04_geneDACA000293 [Acorus gramineus]|uniref:Uncharacterized protein n=1 Tax=Acorus gramineus TaxID=55184 RepID=A0AAV9AT98_ACOGR|nr:hypothetical protein QJS04_geneDACA000293 [Acorus gramineus]